MPEIPSSSVEVFAPDRLIGGDKKLVTDTVTIASGQNLQRGALLGKVAASGKYVLSLAAASDGSQTPNCILVDGANASGGDVTAGVYLEGEFNVNAVTFGAGHSATSVRDGLRALGIHLKTPVPA